MPPQQPVAKEDAIATRRIGQLTRAVILDCPGDDGLEPLAVMPWPGDAETSIAQATVGTIRTLKAAGRIVRLVDDGSVPRAVLKRIADATGIAILKTTPKNPKRTP